MIDWSTEDYAQTYADSLYTPPEDDYVVVKTKPVKPVPVSDRGVQSQGSARGINQQRTEPKFGDLCCGSSLSGSSCGCGSSLSGCGCGSFKSGCASRIRDAETPVIVGNRYIAPFEQTAYVPTFRGGYHGTQHGTFEGFRGGTTPHMSQADMIKIFLHIIIIAVLAAILVEMRVSARVSTRVSAMQAAALPVTLAT